MQDYPGLPSLIKKNLRLLGHVLRMDNNRLPKQLLYSQFCLGMRNQGRPRLRFKDVAKRNMNEETPFSTDGRRVPTADLTGGDLSNCAELENSDVRTD